MFNSVCDLSSHELPFLCLLSSYLRSYKMPYLLKSKIHLKDFFVSLYLRSYLFSPISRHFSGIFLPADSLIQQLCLLVLSGRSKVVDIDSSFHYCTRFPMLFALFLCLLKTIKITLYSLSSLTPLNVKPNDSTQFDPMILH